MRETIRTKSVVLFILVMMLYGFPSRAGEDEAMPDLTVARLSSTNQTERLDATRAAIAERTSAIKMLISMVEEPITDGELFDHCAERRSAAIVLLGQMRATEAIDCLIPCLVARSGQIASPNYSSRSFSFAAHSLAEIGEPAVGPLVARMQREEDPDIARAYFLVLIKMRGFDEAKRTVSSAMEQATGTKTNFERILKWFGESQASWSAIRMERPPWVLIAEGAAAMKRVRNLGSNRVEKPITDVDAGTLILRIQDKNIPNQERLRYAQQLIDMGSGGPDVMKLVDVMLQDRGENSEWRAMCVQLFAAVFDRRHSKTDLETRLLNLAAGADVPDVANESVVQLAYLHASNGITNLPAVLNVMSNAVFSPNADPRTKACAITTIGSGGDRSKVAIVRKALREKQPDNVVIAAVSALRLIGDEADIEVLSSLTNSPNLTINTSATKAIKHISKQISTSIKSKSGSHLENGGRNSATQ